MSSDRILLVTHVALKKVRGQLSIDDQTSAGLVRWSENFERVAYAGIEEPESQGDVSSANWVAIKDLPCADRLEIITMPNAYKVNKFIASYRSVRTMLANQIAQSRYLCFTLGAFTGDWPAIAGLEAIRQKRSYAVWFDRVEHEVIRSHLPTMPLKRRVKETLSLPLMQRYHQFLIRRSQLGLFQGKDCYDYFSQYTDKGFCVYDTHTRPEDFIDSRDLKRKVEQIRAGEPLRICYVGRAAEMKGPSDWLKVLEKIREAGVRFKASWIGDGPSLEAMRRTVSERNLAEIELPGFSADRSKILSIMKRSHLFLFCHKTPESPRCLIESLVSGTPIVGYGSAYARDLVAGGRGGDFVQVGDVDGLSARLVALNSDRAALATMVEDAAQAGTRFDEEKLYRERASLIRESL